MSEVKRLEMDHKGLPFVDDNGVYVLYEDYATLKAERDALATENAALQKQCDAQPVKRPKNIVPSYAAVALSTRDEQWYDAIAEAGYEVQE